MSLFIFSGCSDQSERILVNKELYKQLDTKSSIDAHHTSEGFVVIETHSKSKHDRLTEEIAHLAHVSGKCGGFTSDTEEEILKISKVLREQNVLNNSFDFSKFKAPSFKSYVEKINETLKTENIEAGIQILVAQGTRSARSRNPNKPIAVFMEHIKETLKDSKLDFSLERIQHNSTPQDSIKLRIEGFEEPKSIVVLGGHIDSTGSFFSNKAPGADDNASGSAAILEAVRGLAYSDYKPKKSLEFFWYAGEENGLLGSKEIARSYKETNKKVEAVMQLDMVAYPGNGDTIGLTTDYTNVELTQIVENLTNLYIQSPVERFSCGYGCSDHASWHNNGFKTVFPFESTFNTSNRNIHTERDLLDNRTSMEHALKFSKLAVAFLIEMSER